MLFGRFSRLQATLHFIKMLDTYCRFYKLFYEARLHKTIRFSGKCSDLNMSA